MYKILIQLQDLDSHRRGDPTIHEIHSPHFASIQEAFESIESGKELFEGYLACENEVMKSVNDILNRTRSQMDSPESGAV